MLPDLETERLMLRELTREDALELNEFQKQPEHWAQMAIEPEEYRAPHHRVENYLKYRGQEAQRFLFVYVARSRECGTLIGQVSLSRPEHPQKASLGFGIDGTYKNRGYATEMVKGVLDFGFGQIGLHRISAAIADENVASKRVAEKTGMGYEGIARDNIYAQGAGGVKRFLQPSQQTLRTALVATENIRRVVTHSATRIELKPKVAF